MPKATTLIFDLGNVIINLKPEQQWLYEDLMPHFQPIPLQQLLHAGFFNEFEKGTITVTSFIDQLRNIAIDTDITDEEIIRHWNGILQDIPAHRIDMLYALKERYDLYLLSNTNDIHLDYIINGLCQDYHKNIFADIFTTTFYSQHIGMRKPDRDIYEYVLQAAGLTAANCIFFDDKEENLAEPHQLGIQTVLVNMDIATLTASL